MPRTATPDTEAPQLNRHARRHPGSAEHSPPDMSIADTATYLNINPATVRYMIADGRLKAYRLGDRIIRLRRSEIDAAMRPTNDGAA